jgi:hypothetical protein
MAACGFSFGCGRGESRKLAGGFSVARKTTLLDASVARLRCRELQVAAHFKRAHISFMDLLKTLIAIILIPTIIYAATTVAMWLLLILLLGAFGR